MYNKEKCKNCIYRSSISSSKLDQYSICGYGLATGLTALKKLSNGTVVDLRGKDPNNCMLRMTSESKMKGTAEEIRNAVAAVVISFDYGKENGNESTRRARKREEAFDRICKVN